MLPAIDNLLLFKNEITYESNFDLSMYEYETFKSEISEFVDYYYPYNFKKKNFKRS